MNVNFGFLRFYSKYKKYKTYSGITCKKIIGINSPSHVVCRRLNVSGTESFFKPLKIENNFFFK